MQNNDVVKSMEFIMKQLQTEWERSGEAKKEVVADKAEIDKVVSDIIQKVKESQEQSAEDLTFRQSVKLSHENYIRLRTMRKFATAKKKLEKSGAVFVKIKLDKEETQVYEGIVPEE